MAHEPRVLADIKRRSAAGSAGGWNHSPKGPCEKCPPPQRKKEKGKQGKTHLFSKKKGRKKGKPCVFQVLPEKKGGPSRKMSRPGFSGRWFSIITQKGGASSGRDEALRGDLRGTMYWEWAIPPLCNWEAASPSVAWNLCTFLVDPLYCCPPPAEQ